MVNTISVESVALHNTISSKSFTCAVGVTVIVKVSSGPTQLTPAFVNVGVTVNVDSNKSVVLLTAVKLMFPVPLSPDPRSESEAHA